MTWRVVKGRLLQTADAVRRKAAPEGINQAKLRNVCDHILRGQGAQCGNTSFHHATVRDSISVVSRTDRLRQDAVPALS